MSEQKPRPGHYLDKDGVEHPDRREKPTPAISRYSFVGGKRKGVPFKDGGQRTYVDIYSLPVWAILSAFLALNLLDAHFTLIYLQRGGAEGNPVAQSLLDMGAGTFITVKNLGIGLGAVLFCMLKNFPNGRRGVILVLFLYQILFVYHLLLYFNYGGIGIAA
jgi:hypothetical protein